MFQDETCQRRRPRGYRKKMNMTSPYGSPSGFYQITTGNGTYEIADVTDLPPHAYQYPPQYEYGSGGPAGAVAGASPFAADSWNYVDPYPKIASHNGMSENAHSATPSLHLSHHAQSVSHHNPHNSNVMDYSHHHYSSYASSTPYGSMDNGTYR